ncbi:alpha-amylase [Enterococcus bulliens]
MTKKLILQGFEWYLPADGTHWNLLAEKSKELQALGFTGVWMPPSSKAAEGKNDVGYGVYDRYDLGEFDQKGTIPTKYGTKEEYLHAIHALKDAGLEVFADIVFNQMLGADETEKVPATKYNAENRNEEISDEVEIEAWTKFTYEGRHKQYSDYVWTWENFSGIDYDERTNSHAIFNFADKGWDDAVDDENGNFDYLMGCDLDMNNPETHEELEKWGQWFYDQTQVDGFRLDAVKHIEFSYFVDWLSNRNEQAGRELFVVGEYWANEIDKLEDYLKSSGNMIHLFDVPLHFNFFEAAQSNGEYNMTEIFNNTLVQSQPDFAVTFVDNHDTQKGQSLESWVEGWFKLHAYSLILLRKEGIPVVFWGDLYGMPSQEVEPVGEALEALLYARTHLMDGQQVDYFDDESIIGWSSIGAEDQEDAGMAVLMTNATGGRKQMTIHARFGGKTFVDILGHNEEKVILDETGSADFPVNDGQISVYVQEDFANRFAARHEEEQR